MKHLLQISISALIRFFVQDTWDGRFKNDPLNSGVYVYRVDFTYSFNGKIITESAVGDVTLIR
ncbi:MAG TPA: hypothetical protein VFG10_13220 [Saprospiraceae bacterium]|nr:hypothetical protein [Saprospiraceae bacterium]